MVQVIGKPINQVSNEAIQKTQELSFNERLILHFKQFGLLYLLLIIFLVVLGYLAYWLNKRKNDVLLQRYLKAIDECKINGIKEYVYTYKLDFLNMFMKGKDVYLINNDNIRFLGYYGGQRYQEKYFDLLIFNKRFFGLKKDYKIIRFPLLDSKKDYYLKFYYDKPAGIFINAIDIKQENDYFHTPIFLDKQGKIIDFRDKYLNDVEDDVDKISINNLLLKQKSIIDKAISLNPEFLSKKKLTDVELELKRRDYERNKGL